MQNKVISFDLKADFGFLKKPFSNEKLDLYLTFNMLHKPALLGILGAIIGLRGYKENGILPDYYIKLQDIKIGIEPIEKDEISGKKYHEKGIFEKTTVKYNNTVGYANTQGILNIHEQILITPAYRCFLYLDDSIEMNYRELLYHYISKGEAVYLPYLGKNDFSTWWDIESFTEYNYNKTIDIADSFEISSIFHLSEGNLNSEKGKSIFDIFNISNPFAYFERLPIAFEKVGESYQYKLEKFVYSNFPIKSNSTIKNVFQLIDNKGLIKHVQFF